MKYFAEDFKIIYRTERLMLIMMILNMLATIVLAIMGLINLTPGSPMIKVGYGDIGGYRDGSWTFMLAFPIFAVIFGVLHSLIAVRIFRKRGAGMAKFFILTTSVLIVGAFIVMLRIKGV